MKNSLNTVRLLAAFEVLYFHALKHMEITMPDWLNNTVSFFYGVPVFFMMSGFLIWQSIGNSVSFKQYCRKRFWRVFPELWVAVLIELATILALYHHPIEWGKFGLFAIGQGTIFQFWTPDFLRGYGCGTPNGALWTICVLIQFYFVAYFCYRLLHNRNWKIWLGALLFSVFISFMTPRICSGLPELASKLYGQTFLPYFWMFVAGAFISEFQNKMLPFCKRYWWAFFVVTVCIMVFKTDLVLVNYGLLRSLSLFLCLLGFAYSFPGLDVRTDISYGVYIYHMTVVNAMIALGFTGKPIYLIPVIIVTFILSYLSTVSVGNWAKKMKSKTT